MSEFGPAYRRAGAQRLWKELARLLKQALTERAFRIWFGGAVATELTDEHLVLTLPDEYTRAWIERHYLRILEAAIGNVTGTDRDVSLVVREPDRASDEKPEVLPGRRADELNPSYTFDPFVIGASNRFAHAAALAVAEAPARAYNPLFIYGRTGLGKTHLLQAIAHHVVRHRSELTVRYVTCETFLNDFINSLRDRRIDGFKQRYRAFDVLLVDDVQFLEHKERIQEEFFHTFNALYGAGRQIVLSSDRPPDELSSLDRRLRSRFGCGLIADVKPPDLATRVAILQAKAKAETEVDPDVLAFIAGCVSANVRELEGALTRVLAFALLTERPLSVPLAEEILRHCFPERQSREVSIEQIQTVVCERFGLSVQDLSSDERTQNLVYPRHVAMYLCRELTPSSLPMIGRRFGGRDHTTVAYATSKIERLTRSDQGTHDLVQDLIAQVTG